MLAGMGGVSYHRLVAAVSEAGGFGCLGASTMSRDEMVDEIRAVKALTDKPFGVDLLTALPDQMIADVELVDPRGRDGVRRRARRAARRHHAVPRPQRARRQHVRQGAPRDRRGRGRLRHRRRAGHRGRWPHRAGRDDAARPADRRRGRRPGAGRRRRRASSTAAGSRPRSRSAPTACGSAPASSRRPRRAPSPGYKDALLRTAEDGTVISRAFTRQDDAGRAQRRRRSTSRSTPTSCKKFPEQLCGRWRAARCTSAATRARRRRPRPRVLPGRPGRRRDRRADPGGRHRAPIVAEAEAVIDRSADLRWRSHRHDPRSSVTERLVVIGGDAAGMSAAAGAGGAGTATSSRSSRSSAARTRRTRRAASRTSSATSCHDADALVARTPEEHRRNGHRRAHAPRGRRDRHRAGTRDASATSTARAPDRARRAVRPARDRDRRDAGPAARSRASTPRASTACRPSRTASPSRRVVDAREPKPGGRRRRRLHRDRDGRGAAPARARGRVLVDRTERP